jgi:hypothetical protein
VIAKDDMRTIALVLASIALGHGVAAAGDPAPEKKKKDKDAEKKSKELEKKLGDTTDVHGRVFARATAASEDDAAWQSELGIASARIAVDYQWREKIRAQVEYEAARESLRDAFVQVELGHGLRLRAGRFKLPMSSIENTSAWTLPTIERGMVADILADGVAATGRRSAMSLRWRGEGAWQPTLEVAVSQLIRLADGDRPGLVGDAGNLTVAARASVSPCEMYTIAIAGSNREIDYTSAVDRFWTGSFEVEVDLAAIGYGLRLWGDAMVGQSHLGVRQYADPSATFATAQVIAAYRVGGADRNASYVEPYLGGGWFNPTLDHKRDDVTEVVAGVAGGLWKRWRLHGQVAYQNAKSARPMSLLGDRDVNDRITVTTQLGMAF